jgi:hypothetical protein
MRQLIAIAVLTYLFIVVRRSRTKRHSESEHVNGVLVDPSETFRANYDEQGRTPVERVFKS